MTGRTWRNSLGWRQERYVLFLFYKSQATRRWTIWQPVPSGQAPRPPIKIVATSGLVDVGEKDLPEGGRFLPKPYHARQLAAVLRELTGSERRQTIRR